MAHKIGKKAAVQITQDFDRIANLIQTEYSRLMIPQDVASDFVTKCDLLSDHIEKMAGIDPEDEGELKFALSDFDPVKEPGFDPEVIGEEKAGPLVNTTPDANAQGEFTQQENRELRERFEAGELTPENTPHLEPRKPVPGKQATLDDAIAALSEQAGPSYIDILGEQETELRRHSARFEAMDASDAVTQPLNRILARVAQAKNHLIRAEARGYEVDDAPFAKLASAVNHLLPHVADTVNSKKGSRLPNQDRFKELLRVAERATRVQIDTLSSDYDLDR